MCQSVETVSETSETLVSETILKPGGKFRIIKWGYDTETRRTQLTLSIPGNTMRLMIMTADESGFTRRLRQWWSRPLVPATLSRLVHTSWQVV